MWAFCCNKMFDNWYKFRLIYYFRPERIKAIAARFGVDQEATLENILFARAFTSEHQMELIIELAARFAEEKGAYRLLVRNKICNTFLK
jgi:meiotic recombination protein DMC1